MTSHHATPATSIQLDIQPMHQFTLPQCNPLSSHPHQPRLKLRRHTNAALCYCSSINTFSLFPQRQMNLIDLIIKRCRWIYCHCQISTIPYLRSDNVLFHSNPTDRTTAIMTSIDPSSVLSLLHHYTNLYLFTNRNLCSETLNLTSTRIAVPAITVATVYSIPFRWTDIPWVNSRYIYINKFVLVWYRNKEKRGT